MQKERLTKKGPPHDPRKKVCVSIGNIDLFAYSIVKKMKIVQGNIELFAYYIFKNIEILSDQGVVQSEPN